MRLLPPPLRAFFHHAAVHRDVAQPSLVIEVVGDRHLAEKANAGAGLPRSRGGAGSNADLAGLNSAAGVKQPSAKRQRVDGKSGRGSTASPAPGRSADGGATAGLGGGAAADSAEGGAGEEEEEEVASELEFLRLHPLRVDITLPLPPVPTATPAPEVAEEEEAADGAADAKQGRVLKLQVCCAPAQSLLAVSVVNPGVSRPLDHDAPRGAEMTTSLFVNGGHFRVVTST